MVCLPRPAVRRAQYHLIAKNPSRAVLDPNPDLLFTPFHDITAFYLNPPTLRW